MADARAGENVTGLHKDVVDNQWGASVQRLVKRIPADAPREGDSSGVYRLTTDPHTDEDCPFKDSDTLPISWRKVDGFVLPEPTDLGVTDA